jgi:hypothetical protein
METIMRSTAVSKSMTGPRAFGLAVLVLVALATSLAVPDAAAAHGPVAPVATEYRATVRSVPAGLQAKVIDGYVRLWLSVPAGTPVTVVDYRGAPYLRFVPSGVEVNHNSTMYYLNQTPVASTPPSDLNRGTPPLWRKVSGGHAYEWHDGRPQALAGVAIMPGTKYLGSWRIPLLIGGRPAAISGGLFRAPVPSPVWFWPIAVLLACVPAALRVRSKVVDARLRRGLVFAALTGIALAALARGLHGRPDLSPTQLAEMAAALAFSGWALARELSGRPGYFVPFLVAFVALWEGFDLIDTLLNGYVLVALPPFVVRSATVLCLGTGAALILLVLREIERGDRAPAPDTGTEVAGVA